MGSQYRRLEAAGVDELVGAGVYYGSSPTDVPSTGTATSSSSGAPTRPPRPRCTLPSTRVRSRCSSAARRSALDVAVPGRPLERDPRSRSGRARESSRVSGDGRLEQIVVRDGDRRGAGAPRRRAVHPDRRRAHLVCAAGLAPPGRARLPDHRARGRSTATDASAGGSSSASRTRSSRASRVSSSPATSATAR